MRRRALARRARYREERDMAHGDKMGISASACEEKCITDDARVYKCAWTRITQYYVVEDLISLQTYHIKCINEETLLTTK